jgi:hypothetical protein
MELKEKYKMKGRDCKEYKAWRLFALKRAGWKCEEPGCKCTSAKLLHVHHKKSWALYPLLRFDNNNSEVLCFRHHCTRHPHMMDLLKGKVRKKRNKLNRKIRLINKVKTKLFK